MEETFIPTTYKLQSLATGNIFEDTGWMLDATGEDKPALIRAIYGHKQLHLRDDSWGCTVLPTGCR